MQHSNVNIWPNCVESKHNYVEFKLTYLSCRTDHVTIDISVVYKNYLQVFINIIFLLLSTRAKWLRYKRNWTKIGVMLSILKMGQFLFSRKKHICTFKHTYMRARKEWAMSLALTALSNCNKILRHIQRGWDKKSDTYCLQFKRCR